MEYGVATLSPWGSVPSRTRRAGAVPIGEAWATAGPGRDLGRLETVSGASGQNFDRTGKAPYPIVPTSSFCFYATLPLSYPASRPERDSNPQLQPCALPLSYPASRPERDSNPQPQDFPATAQRNAQGQCPGAPPDFFEVPRRAEYRITDRGKKFIQKNLRTYTNSRLKGKKGPPCKGGLPRRGWD